jgi:hypothetical protein
MGVDIHARVTWGEAPDEIRQIWLKKGAPAEAVEEALKAAALERREHFRQRGRWDLLIALGLLLAGGLGYLIVQAVDSGQLTLKARAYAIVAIAAVAAPIAGLFLGIRGFRRVFVGGDAGEAASDIDHSD